jgi:23S rRNA (pseudouridine1915-N3)-methyltransferase
MNFKLIVPGRLKEKYLKDACAEYEKRLSAFGQVDVLTFEPVRLPDDPSDKEILRAIEKEAENILKMAQGYIISMCIEGKKVSSPQLAKIFSDAAVNGYSCITFIIGSSYGLSETVKKASSFRLSMSDMTFPHQLARVMLLEQIYRANMINSKRKYHK